MEGKSDPPMTAAPPTKKALRPLSVASMVGEPCRTTGSATGGARTNPSSPGEPIFERSEPARINAVKAIDAPAIVYLMVVNIDARRLALPFTGVAVLAL